MITQKMRLAWRTLAMLMTFLIVFSSFGNIAVYAAHDVYVNNSLDEVVNRFLSVQVDKENGRFLIGTLDGDPNAEFSSNVDLLTKSGVAGYNKYVGLTTTRGPQSTFTTIRINDKDYIFGNDYSFLDDKDGLISCKPVSECMDEAVWKAEGVEVVQQLETVESDLDEKAGVVKISYSVKNTTDKDVEVGTRILLDTCTAFSDYTPFLIPGEKEDTLITKETAISGDEVPEYWKTQTQYGDTPFSQYSFGLLDAPGAGKPDKMIFAHWSRLSSVKWDFIPDPNLDFTTTDNTYKTADSGAALYWSPSMLKPGETKEYITYYGIGLNLVSKNPLNKQNITYPTEVTLAEDGISYKPFRIDLMLHNTFSKAIKDIKIEFVSDKDMYDEDVLKAEQFSAILGMDQVIKEDNIVVPSLEKNDKQFVTINVGVYELIDRTTLSGFSVKVTYKDPESGEDTTELFPCSIVIPALKRIPEVLYTAISPAEFHYQESPKIFYIQGSGFDFIKAWQKDKPVKITFANVEDENNVIEMDDDKVNVKSDNIISFWTPLGDEAFIKDAKYNVTISTERFGKYTFPSPVVSSTKEKYRNKCYGTLFIYRWPGEFEYNIKVCDAITDSDVELFDEIRNREKEVYGTTVYNNSIDKYIPLEIQGKITGDVDSGFGFEDDALINNTITYKAGEGRISDLTVRKYQPDGDHDSPYIRMDGTGLLALADMNIINGQFGVEVEDGSNYSVFYDTGDANDPDDDDMGSIFPDEKDIPIEPVYIEQINPIEDILQNIQGLPVVINDIILRDSSVSFGGYAGIFIDGDILPDFNNTESKKTTEKASAGNTDNQDEQKEAKSQKVKKKIRKNRGRLGGSVNVYDLRYSLGDDGKAECVGIRADATVEIPQGIIPMLDIGGKGRFYIDSYGAGYIALGMDANFNFDVVSGSGKLRLEMDDTYGTCIILPDTIAFEIGVSPGIPIFPPIILFSITRGGGGVYNLAFCTSATDVGEGTGNLCPIAVEIVAGIADPTSKIFAIDPARIHVSLQETSVEGTFSLLGKASFRFKGGFGFARRYVPYEYLTETLTGEGELNVADVLDVLLKLNLSVNPYNPGNVLGPLELGGQLQGTLSVPLLGDIVKVSGGINSKYAYGRGKALGGRIDVGAKYMWATGELEKTIDMDLFASANNNLYASSKSNICVDKQEGYICRVGTDPEKYITIDNFKMLFSSKNKSVYLVSADDSALNYIADAETADTSQEITVNEDGKKLIRVTYSGTKPELKLQKPDGTYYDLIADDTLYSVNSEGEESEIIYIDNSIPGTWRLTSDKAVDYELIAVEDIPEINSVEVLKQDEVKAEVFLDTNGGKGCSVRFYLAESKDSAGTFLTEKEITEDDVKAEIEIPDDLDSGQYYLRAELVKDETNLGGVYSTNTVTVNNPNSPAEPMNVVLENAGNNKLRITWDAPDEIAKGYLIEILDENGDPVGEVATVYSGRQEGTMQEAFINSTWKIPDDSGEITDTENESKYKAVGMENGCKYKVAVTALNEVTEINDINGEEQKITMKYLSDPVQSGEMVFHEADPPKIAYTVENGTGEPEKAIINNQECYISGDPDIHVTANADTNSELRILQDGLDINTAVEATSLSADVHLEEGMNELLVAAVNDNHDSSSKVIYVYFDDNPPELMVNSPSPGQVVSGDTLHIKGVSEPGASVTVNGENTQIDEYDNFTADISLEGYQSKRITIEAVDQFGNKSEYETTVLKEIDSKLQSVDIGVQGGKIELGEPAQLLLYGQYADGTEQIIDNGSVDWSIEMGDSLGLISKDGELTLDNAYPVMVRATYETGGDGFAFDDLKKLQVGEVKRDEMQPGTPSDDTPSDTQDSSDRDHSADGGVSRTSQEVIDSFLDNIKNVELVKSNTLKTDSDNLFEVDENLTISLPADSIPENILLKVGKVIDDTNYSGPGIRFLSSIYELEPDKHVVFNKPVKLVFHFDPGQAGENEEPAVCCYNPSTGKWEYVGGIIDTEKKTITVQLSHFSKYAVITGKDFIRMEDMGGRWSREDVYSLIFKGIVQGIEIDGKRYYKPENNITRQEFIALMVRASAEALRNKDIKTLFTDADDIAGWAAPYISTAHELGWLQGVPDGSGGTACSPLKNITRAEAATLLGRMMQVDSGAGDGNTVFTDVRTVPDWASPYVAALSGDKIIQGFDDRSYKPLMYITREEAAAMINRYLKYESSVGIRQVYPNQCVNSGINSDCHQSKQQCKCINHIDPNCVYGTVRQYAS